MTRKENLAPCRRKARLICTNGMWSVSGPYMKLRKDPKGRKHYGAESIDVAHSDWNEYPYPPKYSKIRRQCESWINWGTKNSYKQRRPLIITPSYHTPHAAWLEYLYRVVVVNGRIL